MYPSLVKGRTYLFYANNPSKTRLNRPLKGPHCRLKAQYTIDRQFVSTVHCAMQNADSLHLAICYWHGSIFSASQETGTTCVKCLTSYWQSQYSTAINHCTVYYKLIIYRSYIALLAYSDPHSIGSFKNFLRREGSPSGLNSGVHSLYMKVIKFKTPSVLIPHLIDLSVYVRVRVSFLIDLLALLLFLYLTALGTSRDLLVGCFLSCTLVGQHLSIPNYQVPVLPKSLSYGLLHVKLFHF